MFKKDKKYEKNQMMERKARVQNVTEKKSI